MSDTALLVEVLKTELKAAGITYAEVATHLEMSESSVKRMFSQKEMPLSRVDDVCRLLGTDFASIVKDVLERAPQLTELTYEQEHAMVKDPLLLLVAICVMSYWRFEQIVETYKISDAECISRLVALDKLSVIDLRPLNRYSLKVAKTFRWRSDGPIRQYFMQHVVPEYFGGRFDHDGETLLMVHGNINKAAAPGFVERLTRLGHDFGQQHLADQKIDPEHRDGFTLVMGFRRWEFSAFSALRRQPRPPGLTKTLHKS